MNVPKLRLVLWAAFAGAAAAGARPGTTTTAGANTALFAAWGVSLASLETAFEFASWTGAGRALIWTTFWARGAVRAYFAAGLCPARPAETRRLAISVKAAGVPLRVDGAAGFGLMGHFEGGPRGTRVEARKRLVRDECGSGDGFQSQGAHRLWDEYRVAFWIQTCLGRQLSACCRRVPTALFRASSGIHPGREDDSQSGDQIRDGGFQLGQDH